MFFDIVYQNHCYSAIIILGTPCPTHHLKDIRDGVVHIALGLPIKVLCAFDHYEVGREVDPPGKGAGSYQDLTGRWKQPVCDFTYIALLPGNDERVIGIFYLL